MVRTPSTNPIGRPSRFPTSPKTATEYLAAISAQDLSKNSRASDEDDLLSSYSGSQSSRLAFLSRSNSESSLSTRHILESASEGSQTSDSSPPSSAIASTPLRSVAPPPKDALSIAPWKKFDIDPSFIPFPSDPHSLRHSEFGFCENEDYRYTSQWRGPEEDPLHVVEEDPSLYTYLATYISYLILIVVGHVRDFVGKRTHKVYYKTLTEQDGYAALNSDFDSFYTRRLKTRIEDLFSRPATGVAGRTIMCLDRVTNDFGHTFDFTGRTTQALNMSSYNYLGFAQSRGGCSDSVIDVIKSHGIGSCGARLEGGTLDLHRQAEKLVARFLGTEDALVVSMGFATNSTTMPALVSKGCLVISDELNHSSIRFGARLSGAMVRSFKHNDLADLEALLRECISQGQPRTHRPWRKILLVCEGLYSMEGTLLHLPGIMALKEKYKFYLYVDEAHSIGALGPRGRGVCDYFDIDPKSVDILMGTFTKSFGAAGGYIAGSKALISALRKKNHAFVYAESMAPSVIQQVIASMASIMGPEACDIIPALSQSLPSRLIDGSEGLQRMRRLAFNARYLSEALRKLGFVIYGHRDSPIIPLLIFNPGKLPLFSRLLLERHNIVIVVVAYPATPLISGRARFCVSAAHTKDDLDRFIRAVDDVGTLLRLKLAPRKHAKLEDVLRTNADEVMAL